MALLRFLDGFSQLSRLCNKPNHKEQKPTAYLANANGLRPTGLWTQPVQLARGVSASALQLYYIRGVPHWRQNHPDQSRGHRGLRIFIPWRKGYDFLDALIIVCYALLSLLFVAPAIADFMTARPDAAKRLFSAIARAVVYSWAISVGHHQSSG